MGGFKAFRVHKDQDKVAGRVETLTPDALSSGEVVFRVSYSSVNYKDALAANGRNRIIRGYPRIPGIDAAGVVESSSVDHIRPGERVLVTGFEFGTDHDGGYAGVARVPAGWVVPLPPGLSLYEAMALGTAGFTVALCVHRLEANGQTPAQGPMVVTGGTGGVGTIAIDVLAAQGYEVVAVTGKDRDHDFLKSLGAARIIDRKTLNAGTQALEPALWGGAIDNVGGDMLGWLTRTTRPWGNICSVGLAGGSSLQTTVMPFILRGVSLLGITSSGCPPEWRAPLWQRLATDLKPGHLDAIVTRVVELEDLPQVFADMLEGQHTGRTVVRLAGGD